MTKMSLTGLCRVSSQCYKCVPREVTVKKKRVETFRVCAAPVDIYIYIYGSTVYIGMAMGGSAL